MNYKGLLRLFNHFMSEGASSFQIRVVGRTELEQIKTVRDLEAWWINQVL